MTPSGPATVSPRNRRAPSSRAERQAHAGRLLLFIVAYNAESTIERVLSRIPASSLSSYETEVLIIDDASQDRTFEASEAVRLASSLPFRLTVLANPVNQGYGGNQKLGFLYAIEHGFDVVALLHGDGQYAPEVLPELLRPLLEDKADAVLGSRMMDGLGALKGGMPLYKYVGNRVLTAYQNVVLGTHMTEFHSGYRLYKTAVLRTIPLQLNTNGFHFDTEIIIQLLLAKARIVELPIPTYYGDEICYVNGLRYAWDVVRVSTAAWLQTCHLAHRRNFDLDPSSLDNTHYTPKLRHDSTHTAALAELRPGQTVLDLGCGPGYLATAIKAKGCRTIGVDRYAPSSPESFDQFVQCDLEDLGASYCVDDAVDDAVNDAVDDADVVLMLDVLEHLKSPELLLAAVHQASTSGRSIKILVSTGNVAFIAVRLMLLLGRFNYGKRGILDLTHTRLFTFDSLRRLFEESGFAVCWTRGIPAPVDLIVGSGRLAKLLLWANQQLISLSPSLFAYQIFMVLRPLPTVKQLLHQSHVSTAERSRNLVASRV